jgi:lipopolysaccharide assembly protein B
MDFDFQWLLLAFPAAFLLGWLASRIDLKQIQKEDNPSPQAYFKGLNLLLNEQQDKAIDAFIEAVQHDPGTSDLHFALGNLFRRRGEYERAIRVHEHLLSRADLSGEERAKARYALAQDFLKAGLMDRAEDTLKTLAGTAFNTDANMTLLTLFERTRHWQAAIDISQRLETDGAGSFAARRAHYWCEIAHAAEAQGQTSEAAQALEQAKQASPQAARPLVMQGQRHWHTKQFAAAMQAWEPLMASNAPFFALVADDYAQAAIHCGQETCALERLKAAYDQTSSVALLQAINRLEASDQIRRDQWISHLKRHPSLTAAQGLIRERMHSGVMLADQEVNALQVALDAASRPLQRYRCAACGFEGQHYFWQCPGCQSWDSYPPRRLEEH